MGGAALKDDSYNLFQSGTSGTLYHAQRDNDANTQLVMPDAQGAWADLRNDVQPFGIIGFRRFHAIRRIHEVTVDGARLHFTFSSIFQRILRTHFRRSDHALQLDIPQHTIAASNYLARRVILQMAAVLRNKLAACGQTEQATRPVAVGGSQLVQLASLIETFGVFAVQERFHDRVLYVAQLSEGDGNYGVAPESVSMKSTACFQADSIPVFSCAVGDRLQYWSVRT